ncbi:LacI family DNA-binding transcriptional regulator [Shouchella clausii]|uniref:LacI family DNA-binding transcriptional regulator n=1 Tax=Shouchella clausii TaxID=79880 RepID=UPI002DBEC445|nr:LacI family DNA-binding transcriptional regulator [Shouchella clausii]MEB5482275.1 LacI family DNA-binding transcriptional regulator [Shouchella clausii]
MRKDINITEVAKEAGVSIATVSRVINNPEKVKPSTREKIEKIIEETGYRPNILARELAEKRTRLVGIIAHSIIGEGIPNSIYGISEQLEARNFNIMIACTNGDFESEKKNFHIFQSKRVEGILFFTRTFKKEHEELISRLPFPVIVLLQETEKEKIPYVAFDNFQFAKEATEKLIAFGHQHVAFIGGPKDSTNSQERLRGFLNALETKGLPIGKKQIYNGDYSIESGYEITKQLMMKNKDVTAIVAVNDGMAIGAINCLIANNIRVPDQVSVLGLDDTTLAKASRPALTGVHYSYKELGKKGAMMLLRQIEEQTYRFEKEIIPYEIKIRGSVAQVERKE